MIDNPRLLGNLPGVPRKLRVEYPGAIIHVMNRGDRREPIFKDDVDHRRFLDTLVRRVRSDWQVL